MNTPSTVLDVLKVHTPIIDGEIQSLLAEQDKFLMYDMMSYFFGYLDGNLNQNTTYGGKRFRPGICMLCGGFYGKENDVLGAAAAIEIFHNFTLIHDDIEDNDPMRRGRETVWKKWGISHGINTGDTQLLLAFKELDKRYSDNPELFVKINSFLTEVFKGVAEGQFLDFKLAEMNICDEFVTEDNYKEMIKRKSAILVAASAKVAGMIAGANESDLNNLWQYGLNLGYAYQLNDDLISIWGDSADTGKVEAKDIEEHKKTLPIIYCFNKLNDTEKERFLKIFGSDKLTHDQVSEIKSLLDKCSAFEFVWNEVQEHLKASNAAISNLSIDDSDKLILTSINEALIPNLKGKCK